MKLRIICRCLAAASAAALTLALSVGTAFAEAAGPAGSDTAAGKATSTGIVKVGTVTTVSPSPTPAKAVAPAKAKKSTKSVAKKPPAVSTAAPAEAAASPTAPPAESAEKAEKKDGDYTLKGGQDRTDFRSLTVEGEDRVHVEIERPPLALQLNPAEVKGLDFGTAQDVLDRTPPDLTTQYLAVSAAAGRSPYTGRPWLRQFASGSVARFQPAVRGTERWKLTVADSHGQTVAQFGGKGDAPKEITWDGKSITGAPVTPGITYSYVFEAVDKAGNKRNFVGQGFRVSAYKLDSALGPVLVFSGQSLQEGAKAYMYGPGGAATRPAPPIVLEAASALNQSPKVSQPVRVNVTGRTYEYASSTAKQVAAWIADLTIGDPARVQAVADVQADAPDGGTVRIAIADGLPSPGNAVPTMSSPSATKGQNAKGQKKTKK